MAGVFYKDYFNREFPVTMLLLERVQQALEEQAGGEALEPAQLIPLLRTCIDDAGLREKASKDDATYLLDRLNEMMKKTQSDGDAPAAPKKQTFASSYAAWAAELDFDAMCLVACSFDYFRAAKMYREVDKDDVLWLADQYLTAEWERIRVGFESVVYGFGGSYKDDKSSGGDNERVFDLASDNPQAVAAAKKLL